LQPGTAALRPSVLSQKRDLTSVTNRPTHVAQNQGPTPGAVTSSSLSEGRASRMCSQSRDKRWEELLDAVIVERAEVKPE
jgi:hypothetical protein